MPYKYNGHQVKSSLLLECNALLFIFTLLKKKRKRLTLTQNEFLKINKLIFHKLKIGV